MLAENYMKKPKVKSGESIAKIIEDKIANKKIKKESKKKPKTLDGMDRLDLLAYAELLDLKINEDISTSDLIDLIISQGG